MQGPLRVLFVEDSKEDVLLLTRRLQRDGYDLKWKRVDNEATMEAALNEEVWDVIIADHSMPHFNAPAALTLMKEAGLDLPFIIVSGVIGEETAVAAMRAGAHDYITKDNLARLIPAIERELREAEARREHARVEEALLDSLQTSMEVVQAIPSGLFIYQHKPPDRLVLIFGNPEAERLTGVRIEESLGKDFDEIWPQARKSGISESFLNVMNTGENFESEELFYEDDRTEGFFRVRAFPMGGNRLGVAFENITESKQAQKALEESEERFRQLAENVRTIFWMTTPDLNKVIYVSPAYEEIWGRSCESLYEDSRSWIEAVHEEDRQAFLDEVNRKIADGDSDPKLPEYRIIKPDGSIRWISSSAFPVRNEQGDIYRIAGISEDITEQKQAEEAIRDALDESRKRAAETAALLESSRTILERHDFGETAKQIFESCKNLIRATGGYVALLTEDGEYNDVMFLDSGGRRCDVDPSLRMPIRGLRVEAYKSGKPVYENNFLESQWTEMLPPKHMEMENVMFAPLVLKGKAVGLIGLANKPGGFNDDDTRMAAAFADKAAIALQNSSNIEALRASEARYRSLSHSLEEVVRKKVDELRQAESLAAVGRMVSIVAHEVRNPLQNIMMGVDSMRGVIKGDRGKTEILEEIEYGVSLLNGIIVELLDYSRPLALKYSTCAVRDLVGQTLKTMAHKLERIYVQIELEDKDRQVSVDTYRITAVLVNILSNAAEAMPGGGQLKISSKFGESDGVSVLKLSFKDNGCGISEEDMRQIHEPFFTTKTKGTGLGLPVCNKIVEAHNGKLSITSKLNKGTTVEISLPVEKP